MARVAGFVGSFCNVLFLRISTWVATSIWCACLLIVLLCALFLPWETQGMELAAWTGIELNEMRIEKTEASNEDTKN